MRIILSPSTQEAADTVAMMVLDKIESHPQSVLGLATGRTMEPVYKSMVDTMTKKPMHLEKCFFFMLDEYLGLPENHASSFKSYIEFHLVKPLNLHHDQFAFPPVHTSNLELAAENYERCLREAGGVDLQLLGIGTNGHIGFNEPGSLGDSRTRRILLTEETRLANKTQFKEGEMPREALSMGIGSILDAKSLIMLASGRSKADAIKYLMNHHDDPKCPATYLKSHPHFTLVLDPDAASKINLTI